MEINKWSDSHESIENSESGTFLLKNKYGCSFAHELVTEDNLNLFKEKMNRRIERFGNVKNPTFVRFENSKYKKSYNEEYEKLQESS